MERQMRTKVNKKAVDTKTLKKLAIAEKFISIAPSVSENDKARAIVKFETNMSTVNRYLRGHIGFIDFGERLFSFFKSLVDKRLSVEA